ncbi:hypothetical protein KSC_097070 [Ktedonobacter sp. SOSP1-52]|uniref:glycoside hydrolase family 76 protein n=1 Tax=Ktedonobacter sp. SOSP1-52 TaxID=2778366 RepID=UPI001916A213|nr:glycoside hydrolase family 76 protein [Ktedonobacter sp. SOSP1-52]GHO70815.1 hypothetical protein KSC_097070 [Ktedonobacter sp. SOSP1-52]
MFTQRFRGQVMGIIVLFCLLSASLGVTLDTHQARAAGDYRSYANSSAATLQSWYNSSNGLFNSTGWWNSANALGAIIDYSSNTGSTAYTGDIATTYSKNSSGNFLNNYYDDEGWWGLTWVKAYDLTGNNSYLSMAKTIFSDMAGGWDSTCGGGVWWSKDRTYKNAIPNELFLALATKLHQRTSGDSGSGSYIDWANREWSWFNSSGMINGSNLVNDGLDSSCHNNGQTTWTYNQGVILGGLTDMYKITNNSSYLSKAEAIADAATGTLVNNGILKEPCEPSSCGGDGPQFKGIFMRNLGYLYSTDNKQAYKSFITQNVDSIWNNDRNGSNQLGLMWYGPFDSADAARQSSAQDALNAAIPFSTSSGTSNVALNKTATADSSCSSSETPNKAVDGSVTNDSKWCSGGTSGQYWLRLDLGASYAISSFTVKHAGAGGENTAWNTRDFNIQLSSDGSNWSTVVNVTGNTASITTHSISTTTARYVKLNITNPQSDPNYIAARIYELEVYATSATSNVALNKTATANNSCTSSETPNKAVDGSVTNDSKWCAGATSGQYWLRIDLGANYAISSFTVKHAGAGGENTAWNTRDFNLQLSTDGSNWNTVVNVSGNTSSITTHPISTTTARYVKLNITNPQTDPNTIAARIYELEVYGS